MFESVYSQRCSFQFRWAKISKHIWDFVYLAMIEKRQVFVCGSYKPRIHGGGCCSDRGGERLADELQKLVEEKGLTSQVSVKVSGCLRNCRSGVNMKILPDNTLYAKVTTADLTRILDQHLIKGRVIKSLEVKEVPGFLSY